jgi:hypothetical protein
MIKKTKEIEQAIELRKQGLSLKDISFNLKVSKSSVSVWVKEIPQPLTLTKEYRHQKKLANLELIKRAKEEREKNRPYRILSGDGRWMIRTPEGYKGKSYIKGRYIYEHRFLMEQKIGRLIKDDENVHHINGKKLDNRLENLQLLKVSKHVSLHNKKKRKPKVSTKCPLCGKTKFVTQFFLDKKNSNNQQIFCSRKCSGKFNSDKYWNKK